MSVWHRLRCFFGAHEASPVGLIFAGARWGATCKHCDKRFWRRWQ